MKKFSSIIIISFLILFFRAASVDKSPATKAELGKLLFFDPILSKDKTISCASCHKPAYAFADTSAVSAGVRKRKGARNTPTAMNVLLQRFFFWDGRAKSLEEQALAPIENPIEMNLPIEQAILRLENSKKYSAYFETVFKSPPTKAGLAEAIASYERTLETSNSPFDNWKFSGDSRAVSDAAKKGFVIFNGKGKCIKCHFGADFTANEFRNIGLFNGRELNDSGRFIVTQQKEDIGRFKTPSLRNVAVTGPYMHNGKFKTLKQVIDFYNDPGKIVGHSVNRDSLLAKPLGLTRPERAALESFLISLTDKRFVSARKN